MSAPRSSPSFRSGAVSSRGGSVSRSSGSGSGRKREDDDGLDQIDFSDVGGASASLHRASRAPRSRPSSGEYEVAPSVVVAPHAEEPPASQPRKKRGQEPTLVIRDRRQVQEIRAQVEQFGRRKAASRRRSILLWVGAGLTAFAMGGAAVSFLGTGSSLASSLGGSASNVPVPAAPVQGTSLAPSELGPGKPATVTPAVGAAEAEQSARAESVKSVAASSPSATASESAASTVAAQAPSPVAQPVAEAPVAPSTASQSAASKESVVSIDELSDAAKKKQSASKSVAAAPARDGNVVSLDDLPTE